MIVKIKAKIELYDMESILILVPDHRPELAARFVAASLATAAQIWLVLGASAGYIYERLHRTDASEGGG